MMSNRVWIRVKHKIKACFTCCCKSVPTFPGTEILLQEAIGWDLVCSINGVSISPLISTFSDINNVYQTQKWLKNDSKLDLILTLFGFTENMKWIMNTAELKRLVFAYWKVYKAVTQHNARQCTPCPFQKQLLNRPACEMQFWLIHLVHSFPFLDSMPKSEWAKRTWKFYFSTINYSYVIPNYIIHYVIQNYVIIVL